MKSTFLAWVSLALLAPALTSLAQPSPSPVCLVDNPRIPVVDWGGKASYRARATVKEGHVVAVEVTTLTAGVDRRAQRALVFAINEALRGATCQPGDHEFVQTFSFDIPRAPAAPASDAAG